MSSSEERAYEKVKRAIMLKRLVPGQRITEDWVSKELNMSRTPIRAAFKRLESEKLIELVPNKGAIVYKPSNKELRDVFELRIVLETYAARLAVPNLDDAHLEQLEILLSDELETYKSKNFEEFLRVNGLIHTFLSEVSGNEFLLQEVDKLNQWSDCYLILRDEFYSTPMDEVKSIPEHRVIFEHLQERDSEAAEAAIRNHLLSTLSDLSERTSVFY
ncbi:GntR family transcriptional regulator [Halobacillus sp. ACCC02827]|uniref:GntR family transcriptional regulator n=1 Tax=unclassified Halobacillus TaxID=2636472 RepID=UPI0002A4EF33|nr:MULTISPECIES: GntR family transcriptional regulator [unclassified Halobacillus]ELK48067.1 GntR family transcriptional regulator [Halobacillus sp. BAB-2008]WJE16424.1 GntR family transcriptional regulator [Halobacillus sp. ACCC02827]